MWCVSFNLGFAEPYDVSSPSSIFGQKGFGWIVASITHLNRPPMDRLHRACQRQRRPQKGLLPRQTLRSSRVWPSVRTGSGPPPRPGPQPPLLLGSLGRCANNQNGNLRWYLPLGVRPPPPPLMAKFPDIFLPHFFSFAIESYIYETDFTLQKYHF